MQGQNDKATEMLGRAAAIDPNNAETRTRLAAGQLQAGEPTQALQSLEQALNTNPSEVQANLLVIMTYLRDRKFDAARDAAHRFEVAQPKSPLPLAALGTIANAQGDRTAARDDFEKALALQPDYLAARMSLAQLDIGDGKPAAALDRYNEILKRDKTNIPALLAIASLQFQQGKSDDAIDALERARAADLTAVDPRFNLVDAYLRRNDASKALVIAAELTTIAPQSARAHRRAGERAVCQRRQADRDHDLSARRGAAAQGAATAALSRARPDRYRRRGRRPDGAPTGDRPRAGLRAGPARADRAGAQGRPSRCGAQARAGLARRQAERVGTRRAGRRGTDARGALPGGGQDLRGAAQTIAERDCGVTARKRPLPAAAPPTRSNR
ncbi:MAG: tetratricopeptide repeat protein [Pseudomonadota bacterium]